MVDRSKLKRRKIVLDTYIEAFCDLFGEGTNAIIRKGILESIHEEFDPNSLAATVGVLLGIYQNGRVPRRYKCIDFVKALCVKEGYDEEYVYGEPSIRSLHFREKKFLHVIEEIFGRSAKVIRRHIYEKIGDPDRVIKIATISRDTDPRLKRYEISVKGDVIEITLCYDDPDIVEALSRIKYGGLNAGLVAYAMARKHGYDDVEFLRGEKINNECVKYSYKAIKRNRYLVVRGFNRIWTLPRLGSF